MSSFIVLEGIDGVGKTSVSQAIQSICNNRHIPLKTFKSPPEKMAESALFFNHRAKTDAHFLFYLAIVKYISDEITLALNETNVLCDRYIYSTLAYHNAAGLSVSIDLASLRLIEPHFAFYLTASESERLHRIRLKGSDIKKGDELKKEKGSFLWRVEREYEKFSNLVNIRTDNLSIEKIAEKILISSHLYTK